jgi:hypothetical protein
MSSYLAPILFSQPATKHLPDLFLGLSSFFVAGRGGDRQEPNKTTAKSMDLLHYISFPLQGLYCQWPIQCLASSEILTPPPLTAFGAGGGHTRWVERGWGVNSSEDARHCSVLYICKYFVPFLHLPISLVVHRHNVQEYRVALLWTQAGEACTQSWEHSSKKRIPIALYIQDKILNISGTTTHSFFFVWSGAFALTKYDLHKFD